MIFTSPDEKYGRLLSILREGNGVAVAFSGGVDSSLLLCAACQALGDKVIAVMGRSPSLPSAEQAEALRTAQRIGAAVRIVETREMDSYEYRSNTADRCYFCKRALFAEILQVAKQLGYTLIVEGSNASDCGDFRPGMRASAALGIRRPFIEVGLTKDEIRALAKEKGLPVWNKPSLACLASRIPYGTEITESRLRRVDLAEQKLRALGFSQVRVRDYGDVARVEVEIGRLAYAVAAFSRLDVVAAVKSVGYTYVALDLEGYRSGSMNEVLRTCQKSI